ncbi:copper chaperone PCu(A)C [Congregibacter sp.]|uniref:copper chaperone PCu(A)C n=1 Tax=Congregibacter sp. TaxID=2744308 RepID=UPI003F6B5C35
MIDVRVPLFVLFSAMGSSGVAETLELSGAWVRAMPPGQKMTAVYMELRNPEASAVSIIGASSPLGSASLHETRVAEGRSTMRAVDTLSVEGGDIVHLEPGGLHIMLMGLKSTPVEGDSVPICLQTSKGDVCADAAVRRTAPGTANARGTHDGKNSHDHH